MITFLFIFIAAFCKSISDTIRVPKVMNDSIFAKFIGHWYIDPEVSWINKDRVIYPISFLWAPFSDLWHLTQTLMISFLLAPALWFIIHPESAYNLHWTICFMWVLCWFGSFEFWYGVWKKD